MYSSTFCIWIEEQFQPQPLTYVLSRHYSSEMTSPPLIVESTCHTL